MNDTTKNNLRIAGGAALVVAMFGVAGHYDRDAARPVETTSTTSTTIRVVAPTTSTTSVTITTVAPTTPATAVITTEDVPDGRCHEDEECWDCETMGNLICGSDDDPISEEVDG